MIARAWTMPYLCLVTKNRTTLLLIKRIALQAMVHTKVEATLKDTVHINKMFGSLGWTTFSHSLLIEP